MSSAAHRFGRVEFWIFVLISFHCACLEKKQLFDIQNSTCSNWWAVEDISDVKTKRDTKFFKFLWPSQETFCLMKNCVLGDENILFVLWKHNDLWKFFRYGGSDDQLWNYWKKCYFADFVLFGFWLDGGCQNGFKDLVKYIFELIFEKELRT